MRVVIKLNFCNIYLCRNIYILINYQLNYFEIKHKFCINKMLNSDYWLAKKKTKKIEYIQSYK